MIIVSKLWIASVHINRYYLYIRLSMQAMIISGS